MKMRFQNWVIVTTTSLVILLSSIFLVTVFGKFTNMSEENAQERFSLIAQQAVGEIVGMVRHNARFVTTQTRDELSHFVDHGHINPQALFTSFVNSLEADPTLYSHYFGLENDEFFQVIAIRGDVRIQVALKAPHNAFFAMRTILRENETSRQETWRFYDENRRFISERQDPAKYAPTERVWYKSALGSGTLAVTPPYLFSSTGELGLTVAAPLAERTGALGTDISLFSLNTFLSQISLTPNGAILMLDGDGRVLAFHSPGKLFDGVSVTALTPLEKIDDPFLKSLHTTRATGVSEVTSLGEGSRTRKFVVSRHVSPPIGGLAFQVVSLAPMSDFSEPIDKARQDVLFASLAILLVLLPLALLGSRQVVQSLQSLASNSERLKQLDFSTEPHKPESFLYEINALGEAQVVMQHSIKQRTSELKLAEEKLARLVANGIQLAREQDRTVLLRHILFGAREIAQCAAATLFLKTERNTLSFALRTNEEPLPAFEIPLLNPVTGQANDKFVVVYAALNNQTVIIDDVYRETRFDLSGTKRFSEASGFRTVSMLTVPLSPREGEVIGLLQLLNALDPVSGEVIAFPKELIGFVEALAAQSAVALENQNLIEAQKVLMDSLIKIIASAIDAKSPYTGGHCERVPELAVMLAEEATKVSEGPLASFRFVTEDEWREFRVGAWLHDCGKVVTPEYVVDKATKLETIYNRIHEIRTRFEILLRDAEIGRLQAIAAGETIERATAAFEVRKKQLLEDFAFVAECNIGGEYMDPGKVERLERIARETWWRHFDDRLGLSHEELKRYDRMPRATLPVEETLLADKPHHLLPRGEDVALDPKYGFQINVPPNLYNFGELYNLRIARGTLTDEERYKVNEHIVQTIVMLDQMPFPKHLRRVPEYAGTHHETLTGSGYPRKLTLEGLSVPSRIMAIADIFEALTASDRPYKKAKTLSESVKILSFFKKDRHIDPDLFDLFLTSGVYRRYGEHYLLPEQLDEVDISRYVG
ncbi:MAG: GAF domain-containing protein [Magnetococcales bacterium]|nr:GAF domain-containing protein [Magnetococcales bacterium]